ncbi:hypothetical protein ABG067_007742 [Albugo candida]
MSYNSNYNPTPLPLLRRSNTSVVEQSNSNEMNQHQIRVLNNKIDQLQRTQEQLIKILSPLFPRIDESENLHESLNEAAADAQESATASIANANMRGDRFIVKVPQGARKTNSTATPSNKDRIKAMLKVLRSVEEGIELGSINDEDIAEKYKTLKVLASRVHGDFVLNNTNLKGFSWYKLGENHPSLKNNLMMQLEGKAFQSKINLHYCVEMWGADRLLFEAFRGTKQGDSGEENVEETNNPSASTTRTNDIEDGTSDNDEQVANSPPIISPIENEVVEDEPFSIMNRDSTPVLEQSELPPSNNNESSSNKGPKKQRR